MRCTDKMRMKCNFVLVFIILMLVLCACGDSEPELYTEKKCFEYDLFFLEMNEEGRFAVTDMLSRTVRDWYVLGGTYSLYESKLVLVSNHKDVELVFVADGDNWVFDQEESEGMENLVFKIEDQTIWKPCDTNFYFK